MRRSLTSVSARAWGETPHATHRNIYVRSQRAGERVMTGIERFLAKRLRLKVNKAKERGCQAERPQVPGL